MSTPPLTSLDEVTTQANLQAVDGPLLSLSFGLLDDLPLDKQETVVIPVVGALSTEPKLEARDLGEGSYVSQIRNLVKSSGIYALASMASPLISLVLAPFLTRYLSLPDYGALAVLNTAVALVAGVTQLGLGSAFFRSYNYDYESQSDRLGVISTVIILLSLISVPVALVTIITASWLANFLFGGPSLSNLLRLAALVVLLQNLTLPGFSWLRAENRALLYTMLSIANLLVTLVATIVLVGILKMGIAGSLIAIGIGYAIAAASTLPLMLRRAGLHLRIDIAWGLLAFGLPNVASFVSVWILQLSDRYLLSHLASLTQTASYAVAYSLGGVLSSVIIAPFSLAWPSTMYAIAKKDNAADIFRLVFRWFSIVLLFAAFGLAFISTIVLDVFFPPSYHSAAPIIPIITMSIMFYGAYVFMTVGVSIRRKTWFAVAFTTTSALVNVGLNLVLIPLYGSMGAALSTLLAYVVLVLFAYIVNQRIYPVPFEIGLFIIALLLGIALYAGSDFLAQAQTTYGAWGIHICTLVLYGGCLAFIGMLPTWIHRGRRRSAEEDSVL